jgi:hypothetical protein
MTGVLCEKSDASGMGRVRKRDQGKAVAGKSTLNRLELTAEDANEKSRYKKIVAHEDQIEDLIGDSGFCREEIMSYREQNDKVDYVLELATLPPAEYYGLPQASANKTITDCASARMADERAGGAASH